MIPLGHYLQREKGVEVLYLAGNEEAKKLSGRVVEASLPTVECEEKDEEVQTMDWKSFIGRLFVGCFPSSPISQEIDSLTSLQARSLRLLKRIRPTHIGLYGDSTLGYDMPLIWAAKLLGIKSVVLPVTKSVPDFIAQSRITVGGEFLARGSLLGKVVSFFFPIRYIFTEVRSVFSTTHALSWHYFFPECFLHDPGYTVVEIPITFLSQEKTRRYFWRVTWLRRVASK